VTKPKRLRELLLSKETTILMEAHNGLSAKLVEEAGFAALWGSGLSISAALGVRDCNEASWTQVLEVLEFMSDATSIPMLLDGDTGYGNFNNVRRLVRKLEQRNIAGVCLEDKLFPKTNSFIDGEKQALAQIDEFCGKLRAAKDTQRDTDFMVVARTEAFIAGWGLSEALLRATAYAESGADCILVHSARKDSKEILGFMEQWKGPVPVVIVPTKYPTEPLSSFEKAGITNFIFANQSIRSVITALQTNLKKLRDSNDLMSVEKEIAPVSEIFRIQGEHELRISEKRYLPSTPEPCRGLILAATKGNFGDLVLDKPKCMLRVGGKAVLARHVEAFNQQGIKDVGVVRGYKKETVNLAGLHAFDNDEHATTGEVYSLYRARDFLKGNLLVAYGDILFDEFILQELLSHTGEITIAVDAAFRMRNRKDDVRDLVKAAGAPKPLDGESRCTLVAVGGDVRPEEATGEWIGLLALRGKGTERLVALLDTMAKQEPQRLRTISLPEVLNELAQSGQEVEVAHSFGHWRDLDSVENLEAADRVS